jgi:hypothetical protein
VLWVIALVCFPVVATIVWFAAGEKISATVMSELRSSGPH